MFIPDDESKTSSYHVSRNTFVVGTLFMILMLCSSIVVTAYYFPKILHFKNIKAQNDQFSKERIKVLSIARDMERIKQMDSLIRKSLGTTLDIGQAPSFLDSSTSVFKSNTNNVSFIENIPSLAPISGFISQKSKNTGIFVKKSHNGIDIVAKEGEPILAAAKGVVIFSGWTYELGNMIIIYHGDDYFTHYGHNKNNFKNQLDLVERGEVIASVGSTGISSGPHLHFEVWREFTPLDPLIYFPEFSLVDLTSINE